MRYLSLLICCALLFVSCETEDRENNVSKGQAVSFVLDPNTRANEKESFEDGDAIGVFVLDKSVGNSLKSIGNYADNRKYIYSSEKESFVASSISEMIVNYPDLDLEFYVYYPYRSQIIDATDLLHVIGGTAKEDDFLYAVNRDSNGAQKIGITFKHLLSKVHVKYTSTENRDKSLMSVYTYTDMKINLATGTIRTVENERSDIFLERVETNDYAGFIGVVAPQTWLKNEKFGTLTYSGIGSYPFSFSKDRTFASGEENEVLFMSRSFDYTFSVSPEAISTPAKTSDNFAFVLSSTKCQSINGVVIPGTTEQVSSSVLSKPDWVTIAGNNITVSENQGALRSGDVVFKQDESGKTSTITITQDGGIITYGDWVVTISADPTTIAASGGSSTLTYTAVRDVITNGAVTSTETAVPAVSGSATGFSLSGPVIITGDNVASTTVIASNNTTTSSRSVTYTATHSGKSANCTITQSAGSKSYDSWSDWSVSVSASPTTIGASGGTSAITAAATRTRTWTWNGVAGSGGTETDSGTPSLSASGSGFNLSGTTLTASNNTGSSSRSCTVTATHGGKSANCTVTQTAGTTTYGDWVVTISASPTTIGASGGSSTLTYSAVRDVIINGVVTGTDTAVPTISGSAAGFTQSGASVTVSNNTATSSRSVTYTASHGGKSANCTITQSAGSKSYDSWSDWSVSVSANPTTIGASGGTSAITTSATRTRTWTWNGVGGSGGIETDTATPSLSASGSGFSLSGTTLTASNNTTSSSRSCTVTATSNGKSASCVVIQSGGTTTYGDWVVTISASPITIGASGGSSTLTYSAVRDILTNGVVTGTDTAVPTVSGSATGFTRSGTIVTASNNTSESSRSVTYTASHGSKSASCTITQSGGTTTYDAWSDWVVTISASPTTISSSGGTSTLTYTAIRTRDVLVNGVVTDTETDTATPTVSGSATGFTRSGTVVTVSNNTSTSSRSVTYAASHGGKSASCTIIQSAGSKSYDSWSDWSVSVSANPSTIGASGGTSTITASATRTRTWTWNGVGGSGGTETDTATPTLSASGSGFSLSGTTLTASNNTTSSSRTCTITATSNGKSASCVVTQTAGTTTYGDWVVTISASPTTVGASGGSSTLTYSAVRDILTNGVVTGTDTAVPTVSGSATGFTRSGTVVTVSNNTSTSSRSVTYTASHGGKSASCTITQSAGSKSYGSWSDWSVSVSANPSTIGASGGTSAITASATRTRTWAWNGVGGSGGTETDTATPTLSASGSGFSLSGTTLTASNNTTSSSRSCTVTATSNGKSASCVVTQTAATISYSDYIFTFSDGTTSKSWSNVTATGSSNTYTIISTRKVTINGSTTTETVEYSGSSNVTWGTVSGSTVTVSDNPNTTPRSGVITFTQAESGKTITVTIIQQKKNSVIID
ncbi:fimbrillin family protein [Bacteroides sp. 51]|uniref:fimbrillin family protein n=1 Tax=Bacteroides sp. 51 TaxID=2302938 RepID=UPI0013D85B23|nr:fimbrillin family protein [Bacteroides sp. 51]